MDIGSLGQIGSGQAVRYWQLVNRDNFLVWDGGKDWTAYIRAGEATLWYDAGSSRLLLRDDILETYYYKGQRSSDTAHPVETLSSANSVSGSSLAVTQSIPMRVDPGDRHPHRPSLLRRGGGRQALNEVQAELLEPRR